MITLHGIANCDTVRKARRWLDANGTPYRFRDFKMAPPAEAEIAEWAKTVGWEALLNRRGTTFRGLGQADRTDLDQARALRLMAAHPSLIKRPVAEHADGRVTVGFPSEGLGC